MHLKNKKFLLIADSVAVPSSVSVMLPRILFACSLCLFSPLRCNLYFLLVFCCQKYRVSMKFKLVTYRLGLCAVSQCFSVSWQRQCFRRWCSLQGNIYLLVGLWCFFNCCCCQYLFGFLLWLNSNEVRFCECGLFCFSLNGNFSKYGTSSVFVLDTLYCLKLKVIMAPKINYFSYDNDRCCLFLCACVSLFIFVLFF